MRLTSQMLKLAGVVMAPLIITGPGKSGSIPAMPPDCPKLCFRCMSQPTSSLSIVRPGFSRTMTTGLSLS